MSTTTTTTTTTTTRDRGDRYDPIEWAQKYPHIHGYFVASFPYFNATVLTYTFVWVNQRNNEARALIAACSRGLSYFVDLRIRTYVEPVALKYGKFATKYRRIFFTV